MSPPRRRDRQPDLADPVTGRVRVDPRTKKLTGRLRPGEIAVIDHEDLDQVSAHALAACQPAAVVNAVHHATGVRVRGLPVGLQVVAPRYEDAQALRLAAVIEALPGSHP